MIALLTEFCKIFLLFYGIWAKKSAEDRATILRQGKVYTNSILENILANTDVLNEEAFDKLLTLELKTIYNIYLKEVQPVLQNGFGVESLATITKSRFNLLFPACRSEVVTILTSNSTMVAKAKLISLRVSREWIKQ